MMSMIRIYSSSFTDDAAGWIGVELDQVSDEALESHIRQAWQLIVNKAGKR